MKMVRGLTPPARSQAKWVIFSAWLVVFQICTFSLGEPIDIEWSNEQEIQSGTYSPKYISNTPPHHLQNESFIYTPHQIPTAYASMAQNFNSYSVYGRASVSDTPSSQRGSGTDADTPSYIIGSTNEVNAPTYRSSRYSGENEPEYTSDRERAKFSQPVTPAYVEDTYTLHPIRARNTFSSLTEIPSTYAPTYRHYNTSDPYTPIYPQTSAGADAYLQPYGLRRTQAPTDILYTNVPYEQAYNHFSDPYETETLTQKPTSIHGQAYAPINRTVNRSSGAYTPNHEPAFSSQYLYTPTNSETRRNSLYSTPGLYEYIPTHNSSLLQNHMGGMEYAQSYPNAIPLYPSPEESWMPTHVTYPNNRTSSSRGSYPEYRRATPVIELQQPSQTQQHTLIPAGQVDSQQQHHGEAVQIEGSNHPNKQHGEQTDDQKHDEIGEKTLEVREEDQKQGSEKTETEQKEEQDEIGQEQQREQDETEEDMQHEQNKTEDVQQYEQNQTENNHKMAQSTLTYDMHEEINDEREKQELLHLDKEYNDTQLMDQMNAMMDLQRELVEQQHDVIMTMVKQRWEMLQQNQVEIHNIIGSIVVQQQDLQQQMPNLFNLSQLKQNAEDQQKYIEQRLKKVVEEQSLVIQRQQDVLAEAYADYIHAVQGLAPEEVFQLQEQQQHFLMHQMQEFMSQQQLVIINQISATIQNDIEVFFQKQQQCNAVHQVLEVLMPHNTELDAQQYPEGNMNQQQRDELNLKQNMAQQRSTILLEQQKSLQTRQQALYEQKYLMRRFGQMVQQQQEFLADSPSEAADFLRSTLQQPRQQNKLHAFVDVLHMQNQLIDIKQPQDIQKQLELVQQQQQLVQELQHLVQEQLSAQLQSRSPYPSIPPQQQAFTDNQTEESHDHQQQHTKTGAKPLHHKDIKTQQREQVLQSEPQQRHQKNELDQPMPQIKDTEQLLLQGDEFEQQMARKDELERQALHVDELKQQTFQEGELAQQKLQDELVQHMQNEGEIEQQMHQEAELEQQMLQSEPEQQISHENVLEQQMSQKIEKEKKMPQEGESKLEKLLKDEREQQRSPKSEKEKNLSPKDELEQPVAQVGESEHQILSEDELEQHIPQEEDMDQQMPQEAEKEKKIPGKDKTEQQGSQENELERQLPHQVELDQQVLQVEQKHMPQEIKHQQMLQEDEKLQKLLEKDEIEHQVLEDEHQILQEGEQQQMQIEVTQQMVKEYQGQLQQDDVNLNLQKELDNQNAQQDSQHLPIYAFEISQHSKTEERTTQPTEVPHTVEKTFAKTTEDIHAQMIEHTSDVNDAHIERIEETRGQTLKEISGATPIENAKESSAHINKQKNSTNITDGIPSRATGGNVNGMQLHKAIEDQQEEVLKEGNSSVAEKI